MTEQLSQAEIDALLNGDKHTLTPEQIDAIGEIGNISLGSASTSMSLLLQKQVDITTPKVSVQSAEELDGDFGDEYLVISIEYTEGLKGNNVLIVRGDDAKKIANLMLGGDGTDTAEELDELHMSAVAEIMNQMMGSAATSMSTIFQTSVNISPPTVERRTRDDGGLNMTGWFIVVEFQLQVGDLIDSTLLQLVPFEFGIELINNLLYPASESTPPAPVVNEQPNTTPEPQVSQTVASSLTPEPPVPSRSVQKPTFTNFDEGPATLKAPPRNLELLLDVELTVRVELGKTKKQIREVLDLTPGAIVELDKLAGEPVDVYINNQRIGVGEVVVIDEKFGVRVTEIVSPEERIKRLR